MAAALDQYRAAWAREPFAYLTAAFLFFAILLGGGGAEGPLQNGLIEAGGALLLCALIAAHFRSGQLDHISALPAWLAVAVLLGIAVQLVPLPASLWTALPGREAATAMDLVVDNQLGWRPISLDPEATRRAAAALLLPIPVMLIAAAASRNGLLILLRAIIAATLVSALLGAAQLALGSPEGLSGYGDPIVGAAAGVFANANHHAAMLLCALILSGLLVRIGSPTVRIRTAKVSWRLDLAWLLFPILGVMTFAANSRAGLILLAPALIASVLIATGHRAGRLLILILLLILLVAGIPLLSGTDAVELTDLHATLQDNRLISLPDILYTLQQFWPAGSGLGTFVPVFKANENLDLVSASYVNHAHNDLLEVLIEMGLIGALLLLLGLVILCLQVWRTRGRSNAEVMVVITGASIIALLFLHSLVDYPVRADAVAAVAGLAFGLLFNRADHRVVKTGSRTSDDTPRRGFGSPPYARLPA